MCVAGVAIRMIASPEGELSIVTPELDAAREGKSQCDCHQGLTASKVSEAISST